MEQSIIITEEEIRQKGESEGVLVLTERKEETVSLGALSAGAPAPRRIGKPHLSFWLRLSTSNNHTTTYARDNLTSPSQHCRSVLAMVLLFSRL